VKICDLSSFYSDSGGGVRTYHLAKAAYFARHTRHRYVLLAAGPENAVHEMEGATLHRLRGVPVGRGGAYRQIWDAGHLRRVLREERPDVIEFGSPYLDGWLALNAAAAVDPAMVRVGIYHADVPDAYMAPLVGRLPKPLSRAFVGFWRRYIYYAYRFLDATLATSTYTEAKLRNLGLRNVIRIPLGIDTELFDPGRRSEPLRRSLGIEPGQRLAIFAGRFHPEKSIPCLVAGCQRAMQRDPNLKVVLVGSGQQEPIVRAAAATNPNLKALSYQPDRKRLARLLASADVYIAPGQHETFGLATLEAMSSGLPVVAAAGGGAAELVREASIGRLFTPDDEQALAERLLELSRQDLPALSRRMRQFVLSNYSWDRTFGRMVAHYEQLVRQKTRGASPARWVPA
jgi:alpha-1,6-mannosyltransferase